MGSGTVVCHSFESISASGSSGSNNIGIEGYMVVEDGTVANAELRAFIADVPAIPTGATVSVAIGVEAKVAPGAGATKVVGFEVATAISDPSFGTSIGLYIANNITGATTYAIQSLSIAPSVLSGSLSAATLIESTTKTPASHSAAGTTGQIAWDQNYIYVCLNGSTPLWGRAALTSTGW
jgi:hypothetical protein